MKNGCRNDCVEARHAFSRIPNLMTYHIVNFWRFFSRYHHYSCCSHHLESLNGVKSKCVALLWRYSRNYYLRSTEEKCHRIGFLLLPQHSSNTLAQRFRASLGQQIWGMFQNFRKTSTVCCTPHCASPPLWPMNRVRTEHLSKQNVTMMSNICRSLCRCQVEHVVRDVFGENNSETEVVADLS